MIASTALCLPGAPGAEGPEGGPTGTVGASNVVVRKPLSQQQRQRVTHSPKEGTGREISESRKAVLGGPSPHTLMSALWAEGEAASELMSDRPPCLRPPNPRPPGSPLPGKLRTGCGNGKPVKRLVDRPGRTRWRLNQAGQQR